VEVLRRARLPFIELLASLDSGEWSRPSLCDGWTVQQVAAHVAWASVDPPHAMLTGLVRSRLHVNRLNDDNARRWAERGRSAVLERLRANAASGAKPFGVPWPAPVVDAVIHDLDCRRPLGRPCEVEESLFRLTADFLLAARWPLAVLLGGDPRRRVRGVRLTATGSRWTSGSGPEVQASPVTLLLLLAGRTVDDAELEGPGAATLRAIR
jgi:uncharacterized protein (TIGR03083 family)